MMTQDFNQNRLVWLTKLILVPQLIVGRMNIHLGDDGTVKKVDFK